MKCKQSRFSFMHKQGQQLIKISGTLGVCNEISTLRHELQHSKRLKRRVEQYKVRSLCTPSSPSARTSRAIDEKVDGECQKLFARVLFSPGFHLVKTTAGKEKKKKRRSRLCAKWGCFLYPRTGSRLNFVANSVADLNARVMVTPNGYPD